MMSKQQTNEQYPEHDLGGLNTAVGHENGYVTLSFRFPIDWVGMTPERASELGLLLLHHAGLVKHDCQARIEVRNG
jgi:hypothetical protein